MSRLIDAKKLELQVKEAFKESPWIMGCMLRWIRKQPTVDAVEVVRCKDCKHRSTFKCPLYPKDYGDDFCSCGERRTDDT